MATGYTSGLTDETTLAEFAMKCARAFGALVTMREDPLDAPIPESFEPSDYEREALQKAKARLKELRGMSPAQADAMAQAEYVSAIKRWQKSVDDNAKLRARYKRMLALVRKWKPPTPDHKGLKDFMIEQIESSMKFDCYESAAPTKETGAAWLRMNIESAIRAVGNATKYSEEEIERARTRTKWVKDLRISLGASR